MMQDATPNSANPLQRYLAWAKPIGRPAAEHDARWRNDQRGADRHPTPAAPRERSARMFGKAATMPCCWHQPPAWLSRMTKAPSMVRADQACPQPAPFAPSLAAQQPSRLPVRVLTPPTRRRVCSTAPSRDAGRSPRDRQDAPEQEASDWRGRLAPETPANTPGSSLASIGVHIKQQIVSSSSPQEAPGLQRTTVGTWPGTSAVGSSAQSTSPHRQTPVPLPYRWPSIAAVRLRRPR
jgi:hypothetical protein